MSIIQEIETDIGKVGHGIKIVFTGQKTAHAIVVAAQISALITAALPIAEVVAGVLVPADGPIVAAAAALMIKLNSGFQALSNAEKLTLVSTATKISVSSVVAAGTPLQIQGSKPITTAAEVEAIPADVFNSAAQVAYSLGPASAKHAEDTGDPLPI